MGVLRGVEMCQLNCKCVCVCVCEFVCVHGRWGAPLMNLSHCPTVTRANIHTLCPSRCISLQDSSGNFVTFEEITRIAMSYNAVFIFLSHKLTYVFRLKA